MPEKIIYSPFLLVKDNFYPNPLEVYNTALTANYHEPRDYTGLRSKEVYHPAGIKSKLEQILGIKINRWDKAPELENGVFYQGHAKGKHKEVPGVHSDYPHNDITVVIYLTPGLPVDCGTSLWMHKKTMSCNPPSIADARKLGMTFKQLDDMFESDNKLRNKWIEVDRVGYKFNRMVAYPSGLLHSATNHYGGGLNDVRVYQTFRIGVNWNSFKRG